MATTHALQIVESNALVSANTSLPSIAEVRQKMEWMTAMRPIFVEYLQRHMDPSRHMYSFDNNRYTPMTTEKLTAMMANGEKPALNQDGIHSLMSLYDCYPDEPTIHETREDGHYTCRATLRLISTRSGLPMGAGTGSCSTRETKYAYRWVFGSDVPRGVDKSALRSMTRTGKDRKEYTKYRMENEDVADVEATVLQMAVKRAKSSAVKALPLVSEMFAGVGDPDEDKRKEDEARQELLAPLSVWLKGMKAAVRAAAILTVFGEPLRPEDVAKLDEDRLAVAWQVIRIANAQQIAWDSPTLAADLKKALAASAQQSKVDLFGDQETAQTTTQPPIDAPQTDALSHAQAIAADLVPQIEAAILTTGVALAVYWPWAIKRCGKTSQAALTGEDYQLLLRLAREQPTAEHVDPETGEVLPCDDAERMRLDGEVADGE